MKIIKSSITLDTLHFYAHHGVSDEEQKVGGHYTVKATLYLDLSKAAASDSIACTLNYATAYRAIKEEMEKPSRLLEHVCSRIAARLLGEFGQIESLQVSVTKENPPMGADMAQATVQIEACREQPLMGTPI